MVWVFMTLLFVLIFISFSGQGVLSNRVKALEEGQPKIADDVAALLMDHMEQVNSVVDQMNSEIAQHDTPIYGGGSTANKNP